MDDQLFRLFLIKEKKSAKQAMRGTHTVLLHLSRLQTLRKHVPDLSVANIQQHLLSLFESGCKGRSLNNYIHTLHIYGRFLQTETYLSLEFFPEEAIKKSIMSDQEIELFLSLPPTPVTRYHWKSKSQITYAGDKKAWTKNTLFWKVFAYSGMRPGEVASLSVASLDFGRGVFIANGKTGERFVPIAPILIPELQEYIKNLTTQMLFPGRGTNGSFAKSSWSEDFQQRIRRLDIKRTGLTANSLRHSFITRMLDADINVFKVQDIVGHKRLETTRGYYKLTTKSLVKTITQDPLTTPILRQRLSYNERFTQFRHIVRQALSDLAKDTTEEQEMLRDLLRSLV
jgi:site-specific recombinase XerD